MNIRGRSPRESGGHVTYTHDSCQSKETGKPVPHRIGWLAGSIHGIEAHCGRRSSLCERIVLGSNAVCPACDKHVPLDWMGFVPLRNEHGRPTAIILRRSHFDVAARLKPGDRVSWGRDDGRGQGVWILPRTTGATWEHFWPETSPADNMVPWLVQYLKVPHLAVALANWFGVECQHAVTQEADPVADAGGDAPKRFDQVNEEFVRAVRNGKPVPNGKHKRT